MLRNEDYTDRELLHVIASVTGERGLASSDDIADALGMGENGRSRAGRVAPRLSWMRRYGFIEVVEDPERRDKHRLWRITPIGFQLMGGKLNKPVEAAIDKMDPGAQLLMMRSLTRRTFGSSSEAVVAAVKREYQHNLKAR